MRIGQKVEGYWRLEIYTCNSCARSRGQISARLASNYQQGTELLQDYFDWTQ
jgi:sulfur relay (sulfurtransferase) complex TusBCD TusD component (DsrE family)